MRLLQRNSTDYLKVLVITSMYMDISEGMSDHQRVDGPALKWRESSSPTVSSRVTVEIIP